MAKFTPKNPLPKGGSENPPQKRPVESQQKQNVPGEKKVEQWTVPPQSPNLQNVPASQKQEIPQDVPQPVKNFQSYDSNRRQKKQDKDKNFAFANQPSVWIELSELPSQYLDYPEGAQIRYRPYFFGEVEQFEQLKNNVIGRFELALGGVESSFPVEELTLADFLFISLLRKISTVGDDTKFSFSFVCPVCKFFQQHVYDLNDLVFYDLEVPELPVNAVTSYTGDAGWDFYPARVCDFLDLARKDTDLARSTSALLAMMCREVPWDWAYKCIKNAVLEDSQIQNEVDIESTGYIFPSRKSFKVRIRIDGKVHSFLDKEKSACEEWMKNIIEKNSKKSESIIDN